MREHMSSSSDKRFKDLDYHIKEWYRTVSRIATKLLRAMDTNRSTFEGNLMDCRLDGAHCAMQSNTTIAITDIQARPKSL